MPVELMHPREKPVVIFSRALSKVEKPDCKKRNAPFYFVGREVMTNKYVVILIGLLIGAMAIGCGGAKKQSNTEKLLEDVDDDVNLVSEFTGIDDDTNVPVEKDREEQPSAYESSARPPKAGEEEIGGNKGAFIGKLQIAGEPVNGTITVKKADTSGTVVVDNAGTGSEITLDPGYYDFVFTSDAVVGSPELTLRDVQIEKGRRITRDVKMPVGQINLVTGKNCKKKPIKIRSKGSSEWYEGNFFTCVPMKLMAGEYEADIGTKKKSIPLSGIQVYDGGVRDIMIRNQ